MSDVTAQIAMLKRLLAESRAEAATLQARNEALSKERSDFIDRVKKNMECQFWDGSKRADFLSAVEYALTGGPK